jgi:DNA-binding MarR family transcriptional regulator
LYRDSVGYDNHMIATENMERIEAEQRSALHYDPTSPHGGLDGPHMADLLINRAAIGFESLKTQWTNWLGLGTHERMAISQLWIYGPMQMSELAARISLSRAAVTTLIDRLEDDGWLRRASDATDRRRTILHLEAYAIKRYREASESYREAILEWSAGIPEDEWRIISRFLDTWFELSTRKAQEMRRDAMPR